MYLSAPGYVQWCPTSRLLCRGVDPLARPVRSPAGGDVGSSSADQAIALERRWRARSAPRLRLRGRRSARSRNAGCSQPGGQGGDLRAGPASSRRSRPAPLVRVELRRRRQRQRRTPTGCMVRAAAARVSVDVSRAVRHSSAHSVMPSARAGSHAAAANPCRPRCSRAASRSARSCSPAAAASSSGARRRRARILVHDPGPAEVLGELLGGERQHRVQRQQQRAQRERQCRRRAPSSPPYRSSLRASRYRPDRSSSANRGQRVRGARQVAAVVAGCSPGERGVQAGQEPPVEQVRRRRPGWLARRTRPARQARDAAQLGQEPPSARAGPRV